MNNSRILDQFYTNENIAIFYYNALKKIINKKYNYFYIEPSAGTGAFFNLLPKNSRIGIDLEPKNIGIIKKDFINFNIKDYQDIIKDKKIITIGNPPFGKNSSLALKFLNKSAVYSKYVAFILPKTFKKESMLAKINKNLHLIMEEDIPSNSFNFNGSNYNVPCVFQIWEKQTEERTIITSAIKHDDFIFTSPLLADFAIRRVGGLAGKIIDNYESYSQASHYYIKTIKDTQTVKKTLLKINWDTVKNNTAGNPSISKREIVRLYTQNL